MAANIKAETLVGLSRDVGLARQDTSVAFVRQPCPVPISSFFYLVFIFIHASCSPRHSSVRRESSVQPVPCRLNGARSPSQVVRVVD